MFCKLLEFGGGASRSPNDVLLYEVRSDGKDQGYGNDCSGRGREE